MCEMKIELVKEFRFHALHKLPFAPADQKWNRPHEHGFQVNVTVEGEVALETQTGRLFDYADIEQAMDPLLENYLEDSYLNQIDGLENPTADNIARWLWGRLRGHLPGLKRISLLETCTEKCDYGGE